MLPGKAGTPPNPPPPAPFLHRVKHPNILQLVDVYITRKEYFIFLEL